MSTTREPMLISLMRKRPSGEVIHLPVGAPKTGTTTSGFLYEYDRAIAAAEERGREQAAQYLERMQ